MLRTAATSSTKRAAAGARDLPRASRFSFVHVVEDGPAAEGCWSVFLPLPLPSRRVAGGWQCQFRDFAPPERGRRPLGRWRNA